MIVKVPLSLAVPRMQPLTFAPPSVMNDTTQARAKAEREAKVILREMERCFGREKFKELAQEISKGGQGNTPDDKRNAGILAEWKNAAHKNKSKFARDFCKNHPSGSAIVLAMASVVPPAEAPTRSLIGREG